MRNSKKSLDRYHDIFFIYHPDDLDFARRAAAQLAASGSDCYVDEGISGKTGADIGALKRQLLRAHAAAVVLSPASAESQLCNELIQFTVTNGKRLLTIILDENIEVAVHPAVAEHPFVFFREDDDFVARIDELRAHLAADPKVALHTELLVAADRWQRSGRQPNLLLPSGRSAEARAWLAQASAGEQKPSPLLVEFIHGSRKVKQKQRPPRSTRFTLGAAAAAALIAAYFILSALLDSQARARSAAEATGTADARLALTSEAATALSNSALGVIDDIAATAESLRVTALAQASAATAAAAVTQTAQHQADIEATRQRATQVYEMERQAEARRLLSDAAGALDAGDPQLALALAWAAKDTLDDPKAAYRLMRRALVANASATIDRCRALRIAAGRSQIRHRSEQPRPRAALQQ